MADDKGAETPKGEGPKAQTAPARAAATTNQPASGVDPVTNAPVPGAAGVVGPQAMTGPSASAQAAAGEQKLEDTAGEHPEGAYADAVAEGHGPEGLQAEPAIMTPSGSVPGNMVPSPGGPVPVSTVAATKEDADKIIKAQADPRARAPISPESGVALTEEQVSTMSKHDLRALASQRGYQNFPEAGHRATRRAFLNAQKQDKSLSQPTEDDKKAAETAKATAPKVDIRDSRTVFTADAKRSSTGTTAGEKK